MYPQQSHGTWRGNRCGLLDLEDVGCLETSHGEDLLTQGHECLNGLEELMAERELMNWMNWDSLKMSMVDCGA